MIPQFVEESLRFRIVPDQAEEQAPEPKPAPPEGAQVQAEWEACEQTEYTFQTSWNQESEVRRNIKGRMCVLQPGSLAIVELDSLQVKAVWEANGRKPVVECQNEQTGEWHVSAVPSFSKHYTWRLQPKSSASVVPWTEPEDVPVGSVIVQKASSARFLIVAASKHGLAMGQGVGWHKYADVHRDFEQLDGSACGKEGK